MPEHPTSSFWRTKLAAFLHDSPDKPLDIVNHETRATAYQRGTGFTDDDKPLFDAVKPADHFSASAERFVFPKVKCSHNFAEDPLFIHPLSSKSIKPSLSGVEEAIQTAIGGIPVRLDWHAKFFLHWRRWPDNAAAAKPAAAFLPADSRIPDHTIWTHMSLAAALAPCIEQDEVKPELLLFQIGPVQDFIAQARSARDLWSGSYLLSWLIAHAMKAVTDTIGPDAMIFPSLRGNGIFDALHREAFYSDKWESGAGNEPETTWERFLADKGGWDGMADWLLTPTLPNRFLAVVPAGTGAKHAEEAKAALNVELQAIGEAVWQWLLTHGAKPEWKTRWNEQIKAFPQTTWAVQPWLKRETCLARLNDDANKRLSDFIAFSEQVTDKDDRFFKDGKLNNPGVLWAAHYALLDTKLAARRNTRDFAQWAPVAKETAVKDSLSGKEECIGDEDFWKQLPSDIFKVASHRYDAMNLIKRLWCHPKADIPYLREKLGLEKKMLDRAVRYDTPERIARNNTDSDNPYIAVLAIDGDEIGKWVSGEKLPDFLRQIAPKATEYLQSAGGLQRLLTPSYHLQFSEALAAFAMHKARAVVEAHQGDLIYAGGDDVLAVLPSTTAIACALALREAFRTDFDGRMLLPGSRCEVSCGIAVGHQNAPLQMLVKEAQAAEHDAKGEHGRAAVALRLYKRSGEIIYWGCKWEGPALDLMRRVTELSRDGKLSGKFAYALAAFLRPYGSNFADKAIILAEFDHVLSRQGDGLSFNERDDLHRQAEAYLDALCRSGNGELASRFANLFLAETFLNRFYGDN